MSTPSQKQNPNGLHKRFHLERLTKTGRKQPVDQNAEYFVLRLDAGGSDPVHVAACQFAINAYADAIQHHLPDLANDIRGRYPLTSTVASDEPSTDQAESKDAYDLRVAKSLLLESSDEIARQRNINNNMRQRLDVYDAMVSLFGAKQNGVPSGMMSPSITWEIEKFLNRK